METNEEIIISQCRSGDLADFGRLYDLYAQKIYRFIYRKTLHKETAQDLTSETFVKALKGIRGFQPEKGTFSSWLYRIARNSLTDHYRKRKPFFPVHDAWDIADGTDIERDAALREKIGKVREYLEKLSTEQREIVLLRVWEDLSYKEIAHIVGKSEGSCKMAFSRALKILQREVLLLFLGFCYFFPVFP